MPYVISSQQCQRTENIAKYSGVFMSVYGLG